MKKRKVGIKLFGIIMAVLMAVVLAVAVACGPATENGGTTGGGTTGTGTGEAPSVVVNPPATGAEMAAILTAAEWDVFYDTYEGVTTLDAERLIGLPDGAPIVPDGNASDEEWEAYFELMDAWEEQNAAVVVVMELIIAYWTTSEAEATEIYNELREEYEEIYEEIGGVDGVILTVEINRSGTIVVLWIRQEGPFGSIVML